MKWTLITLAAVAAAVLAFFAPWAVYTGVTLAKPRHPVTVVLTGYELFEEARVYAILNTGPLSDKMLPYALYPLILASAVLAVLTRSDTLLKIAGIGGLLILAYFYTSYDTLVALIISLKHGMLAAETKASLAPGFYASAASMLAIAILGFREVLAEEAWSRIWRGRRPPGYLLGYERP